MTDLTATAWVGAAGCWLGSLFSGARWLRVAQREHYLPGSVSRFAFRWWLRVGYNVPLAILAVVAAGLSWRFAAVALATAAVGVAGPLGLSPRGRTSRFAWTRRSRSLAAVWLVIEAVVAALGFAAREPAFFAAIGLVLSAPAVDLASLAMLPVEHRLASRFVSSARGRLRAVNPRIVGITGSYGKTSTKNYVAHLLGGSARVVASPASFNNRAGLARAVNENLAAGTEVFIAEMGTYGIGEIAELCSWCPPEIAVITAIGPVHLERFGTEGEILRAKTEITTSATFVVLNVDDSRLANLASQIQAREVPPRVWRCSGVSTAADVSVIEVAGGFDVVIDGDRVGSVALPSGVQPTNVACAIGVATQLGVAAPTIMSRLGDLPTVPHRLAVGTAASGVVVIDDTFNSNPAGARAALQVLAESSQEGRRVVVTPGMVELGAVQAAENRAFGEASIDVATDMVVVGRTNRAALVQGRAGHRTVLLRTRDEAVRWVREHVHHGDAVLYENDLPDHYP